MTFLYFDQVEKVLVNIDHPTSKANVGLIFYLLFYSFIVSGPFNKPEVPTRTKNEPCHATSDMSDIPPLLSFAGVHRRPVRRADVADIPRAARGADRDGDRRDPVRLHPAVDHAPIQECQGHMPKV